MLIRNPGRHQALLAWMLYSTSLLSFSESGVGGVFRVSLLLA